VLLLAVASLIMKLELKGFAADPERVSDTERSG
jgi:hypothetical protein